jgi:hypothetical protein
MRTLSTTRRDHPDSEMQTPKPDAGPCGATNPAFDRWLTHHLGRLYDPVIHEPLPADLLRLLESRLK